MIKLESENASLKKYVLKHPTPVEVVEKLDDKILELEAEIVKLKDEIVSSIGHLKDENERQFEQLREQNELLKGQDDENEKLKAALQWMRALYPDAQMLDAVDDDNRTGCRPACSRNTPTIAELRKIDTTIKGE